MRFRPTGFTLIELLVVIAIIGILSAVVLAALSTAQSKGSDAARESDVKSLETAMELYYDANGTYPQSGASGSGSSMAQLASYLVPADIGAIPSLLNSDLDRYTWQTPGNAYGLYIYTSTGWCVTGVNVNAGWWSGPPACSF